MSIFILVLVISLPLVLVSIRARKNGAAFPVIIIIASLLFHIALYYFAGAF
jgi:hypothetical protein